MLIWVFSTFTAFLTMTYLWLPDSLFKLSSDCQIPFFNIPLIVRFSFSTLLWLSDSLFQLSSDCQIWQSEDWAKTSSDSQILRKKSDNTRSPHPKAAREPSMPPPLPSPPRHHYHQYHQRRFVVPTGACSSNVGVMSYWKLKATQYHPHRNTNTSEKEEEKTSPFRQRCVWSGHFGTFWESSEDFMTSLEHLDYFHP